MLVRHRYSSTPAFNRNLDLDRAFEQLTNSFFDTRRTAAPANGPSVEGAWHDDEFVLTVDLPGVPAEAVSVDVTGTTLVLGAQTDSMEWSAPSASAATSTPPKSPHGTSTAA